MPETNFYPKINFEKSVEQLLNLTTYDIIILTFNDRQHEQTIY